MKNASFFSTAILLLSALFISQTVQAQWVNGTSIYPSTLSKKVGIGTVAPNEAQFVVKGDVNHTVAMFGQGQAGISLVRDWATVGFNSYYSSGGWKAMSAGFGALLGCDPSSGRIEFIQNGYANGNQTVSQTYPLVIEPNGNIGIGTTTPESKLDIFAQDAIRIAGYEPFITLLDNNSYHSARIQAAHGDINFFKGIPDFNTSTYSYEPQLIIKNNGNVGIGYATPESKLDIAAQDGMRIFGYQPFMTLLDNNSYHSARIQTADGNLIFWKGVANWETGGYDYTAPMIVKNSGNVLIGTTEDHGYKLAVAGNVICTELKVKLQGNWPDYVFADGYQLKSLEEVEAHIQSNNHLPGIPAAAEIEKEGIAVGDMQKKMMEKIEELTLYLIDQNKRLNQIEQENISLRARLDQAAATQK